MPLALLYCRHIRLAVVNIKPLRWNWIGAIYPNFSELYTQQHWATIAYFSFSNLFLDLERRWCLIHITAIFHFCPTLRQNLFNGPSIATSRHLGSALGLIKRIVVMWDIAMSSWQAFAQQGWYKASERFIKKKKKMKLHFPKQYCENCLTLQLLLFSVAQDSLVDRPNCFWIAPVI